MHNLPFSLTCLPAGLLLPFHHQNFACPFPIQFLHVNMNKLILIWTMSPEFMTRSPWVSRKPYAYRKAPLSFL